MLCSIALNYAKSWYEYLLSEWSVEIQESDGFDCWVLDYGKIFYDKHIYSALTGQS